MKNTFARYLFIFNPAADKGRAVRQKPWLQKLLASRGDVALLSTMYAGHAGDIARMATDKTDCIIACGGDGTLHDVVNAVVGKKVAVGILPMGSANDFVKTLYSRAKPPQGIAHFFTKSRKVVDLGFVVDGVGRQHYFINSMGLGFSGRIAQCVKNTRWLKGELLYVYALFVVLRRYQPMHLHCTLMLEDKVVELDEPFFAVSIANGVVEGGKFRIAPFADISDGLLDVALLKAVPKRELFRYVLKYLRGTHIDDPQVLYYQVKSLVVTLSKPEVMHLDGEVFDNITGRMTIAVMPKALTIKGIPE